MVAGAEPQGTVWLLLGRGQIHLAGDMWGPVGSGKGSIHSYSSHTTFFLLIIPARRNFIFY